MRIDEGDYSESEDYHRTPVCPKVTVNSSSSYKRSDVRGKCVNDRRTSSGWNVLSKMAGMNAQQPSFGNTIVKCGAMKYYAKSRPFVMNKASVKKARSPTDNGTSSTKTVFCHAK